MTDSRQSTSHTNNALERGSLSTRSFSSTLGFTSSSLTGTKFDRVLIGCKGLAAFGCTMVLTGAFGWGLSPCELLLGVWAFSTMVGGEGGSTTMERSLGGMGSSVGGLPSVAPIWRVVFFECLSLRAFEPEKQNLRRDFRRWPAPRTQGTIAMVGSRLGRRSDARADR